MDGKVIDSSLSRDPLVVELGKRTVIPGNFSNIDRTVFLQKIENFFFFSHHQCFGILFTGLEQSLIGVCEG